MSFKTTFNQLSIRELIGQVGQGQIRIPSFQRGFVWDSQKITMLMDSIYKQYPFGSLLFWHSKTELTTEKTLGPFAISTLKPDYPLYYVLDGQQRVTSIYGVFHSLISAEAGTNEFNIFFDLASTDDAQDNQFIQMQDLVVDRSRYFPLNCLLDPKAYRENTSGLSPQLIDRCDKLQVIFSEAKIPVQIVTTDDDNKVSIVFARINQQGERLDTLQLLSAWTWKNEFDLIDKIDELKNELEKQGFGDVKDVSDLILRCFSAYILEDSAYEKLVQLNGSQVRDAFDSVVNGIKGALDFADKELNIPSLDNFPYPTQIIPLSVFFATPTGKQLTYTDNQRATIVKWFWRCCFGNRYSAGTIRSLNVDIAEIKKLKSNPPDCRLGDFPADVKETFFTQNNFRTNSVNSKIFVLLLARLNPLSFISGSKIDLGAVLQDYNRKQFHHVMPLNYLKSIPDRKYSDNCLANICFMSASDNNTLGGVAPSIYALKLPENIDNILNSHLIEPRILFQDEYNAFIEDRALKLASYASKLI